MGLKLVLRLVIAFRYGGLVMVIFEKIKPTLQAGSKRQKLPQKTQLKGNYLVILSYMHVSKVYVRVKPALQVVRCHTCCFFHL